MKKRAYYDYSGFRISLLNEPRFSHLKLLIGWPIYFLLYVLTEKLIPREMCHSMHCAVDDWIPFREEFVIFYVLWFALVFFSLLYYLLHDVDRFKKLQCFIMVTQFTAMLIYIIYPSRQDLRPEVFPRDNFFTWIMSIIYAFDTSTGVCPSLHVAYSMGILSVATKDPYFSKGLKIILAITVILICLATMFVKQHSVVDVLAALPLSLLAEAIVYRSYWIGSKHDFPDTV